MQGMKIDKKEEKFPEILNVTEIRTFLFEAKRRSHEWYPLGHGTFNWYEKR